jgi:hypothetical protein
MSQDENDNTMWPHFARLDLAPLPRLWIFASYFDLKKYLRPSHVL